MAELELSALAGEVDPEEGLRKVLARFERTHRLHVRITVTPWTRGWEQLVKVALYSHGPDVSEIGSSWVSSLVGMNALQPFTRGDLEHIGGASAFLPQAWQSGALAGGGRVWAIPWLVGTRIIFYRRDLLREAGVDEQTAFQDHSRLEQTLDRLQKSGVAAPWVVPTRQTLNTLHYVASWVWGAGGRFVSEDGKRPMFHQESALVGMSQYFGLYRYLPNPARELDDADAEALFWQGEAAVTVGGHWLLGVYERSAPPKVVSNLGVASVPGVSLVGGSDLIVWKHVIRAKREAMDLVFFFVGKQAQVEYSRYIGLFPARLEALEALSSEGGSLHKVVSQGLRTGRSFPSILSWGLVEDKLVVALAQIWEDVLSASSPDLLRIIRGRLEPLAQRLSLALSPP